MFPGWHLIGKFPEGDTDGVGSWLLHHNGEACLLEVPPGLDVRDVHEALTATKSKLKMFTASHSHQDHLDRCTWRLLDVAFPYAIDRDPNHTCGCTDSKVLIGGELLWLIKAPKHSRSDVVIVFRGVAMTGDIELGMLGSVNNEIKEQDRKRSMEWLKGFQKRHNYHIHTTISAHLNDVRHNVNWESLFEV